MLRDVRKKKVKETITRSALHLFKQKGYEQVTVEEIAGLSGIAKGTFFNYFPKKEHVLLELARSYLPLMDQIAQRHREGPPKERLLRILGEFAAIYVKHAALMRLALGETLKSAIEAKDETGNLALFQDMLRGVIAAAQESGALRSRRDPDVCASAIVGMFIHTLVAQSSDLNAEKVQQALELQLDLLWAGIADE